MRRLIRFLLLAVTLSAQSDPNALIGMVKDIEGNWIDRACQCHVVPGYAVVRRSELVPAKGGHAMLHVRIFSTGILETFDCAHVDCSRPLNVLARVKHEEQAGKWTLAFSAISAIVQDSLSTDESRTRTLSGYARAFSGRGLGDVELTDAVVAPDDLSPVFQKVTPGRYLIDLCPVDKLGRSACAGPPQPFSVEWSSARLTSAPPPPGLYELFHCKKDEVRTTRVSSAWILVARDAATAASMKTEFDAFKAAIADWTPREVSMLTHAYLQALEAKDSR